MKEKYQKDDKTGKFIPTGQAVMAEKPITVRLPVDIDAELRKMNDRNDFLREIISLGVKSRINKTNKESA